nr:MAG TPA: hypothetical protein [Caudoviricetes sp.]
MILLIFFFNLPPFTSFNVVLMQSLIAKYRVFDLQTFVFFY